MACRICAERRLRNNGGTTTVEDWRKRDAGVRNSCVRDRRIGRWGLEPTEMRESGGSIWCNVKSEADLVLDWRNSKNLHTFQDNFTQTPLTYIDEGEQSNKEIQKTLKQENTKGNPTRNTK
ncbi:hypothetical protein KSP39_PZI003196 [Platanthera zijinensis]|uniref:Uncharacterized protein n=1 Tax=Platanthera zijinensis TaxID=2320716 RepID=A0AAP0BVZ8_9ASPA